jgi:limonene-1,2-epoxide hydrolase
MTHIQHALGASLVSMLAFGTPASAWGQSSERLVETKRMFTEGWMKRDPDAASQPFASKAVSYTNGIADSVRGPEDVKETVQMLRTDYPDFTISALAMRASGNHVYTWWRFQGTDKTTHKKASTEGMNDDTWKGNQIIEERSYFDLIPLLKAEGYTIKAPAADSEPSAKK